MNQIEIWNNRKNTIPLIVSIPHSGTYIPPIMKKKLADHVVLANIDWYLPSLYSFLKDLGITTIINRVSRYVIDPNREICGCNHTSYLRSYLYTKTTFGNSMYREDLEDKEVYDRIVKYYNPYHQTLDHLIHDKLTHFNKIYLIDLHSFGKDINTNIVLGNRNGKTSGKEFTAFIKDILEKLHFNVNLNNPYSGGYIIRKYANNNVETLQLELSYKNYIDGRTFGDEDFPLLNKNLFFETQEKLQCFFTGIANYLSETC